MKCGRNGRVRYTDPAALSCWGSTGGTGPLEDAVGAYAEYCLAPAAVVAALPAGVPSDVAAAAILKGMTAQPAHLG